MYTILLSKLRSKLVVLEEVVRIDITGCPSGTRS